MRSHFGCKVGKAALDGGFTCPNIDGTKGTGGCIYCSGRGSGDFAPTPEMQISQQYAQQRAVLQRKWPGAKCIAYFQAHSGTYAPLSVLRPLYETALAQPDVAGLCIATRADLLQPDVVEYLAELSRRTFLLVELGLQTIFDDTAQLLNRCHSYQEFLEGYHKLTRAGVAVCVHLINYLPHETTERMLQSVKTVGALNPHSIKLHMLYILQGTPIAEMYRRGEVELPDRDTYIHLVCSQLELIPPQVVVQRLTGDPPRDQLIAPLWAMDKRYILNSIDKEMARRDSWQGKSLTL